VAAKGPCGITEWAADIEPIHLMHPLLRIYMLRSGASKTPGGVDNTPTRWIIGVVLDT
jgi:hypothetical protein